jgi:hypothetical protein
MAKVFSVAAECKCRPTHPDAAKLFSAQKIFLLSDTGQQPHQRQRSLSKMKKAAAFSADVSLYKSVTNSSCKSRIMLSVTAHAFSLDKIADVSATVR